jgi:hypothetical protein
VTCKALYRGVDAALALLLPTLAGTSPTPALQAHAESPWHGKAHVKSAKDSRTQWDAYIDAHPEFANARI